MLNSSSTCYFCVTGFLLSEKNSLVLILNSFKTKLSLKYFLKTKLSSFVTLNLKLYSFKSKLKIAKLHNNLLLKLISFKIRVTIRCVSFKITQSAYMYVGNIHICSVVKARRQRRTSTRTTRCISKWTFAWEENFENMTSFSCFWHPKT